jgi:hypothetical protein
MPGGDDMEKQQIDLTDPCTDEDLEYFRKLAEPTEDSVAAVLEELQRRLQEE